MTAIRSHVIAAATLLLTSYPAASLAQTAHIQKPYAGIQTRAVKALSDEQIADLRAGRGMGLALAAELNGYPGPLHVLENADALALSPGQHERTKALFQSMQREAVPLGELLIEQELELDRLFATRTVQPTTLEATTAAIGATQGQLRSAHLRYHLAMMDLLTPEQLRRYAEVRGYSGPGPAAPQRDSGSTRSGSHGH